MRRIVSLLPAATEIVCALGAADELIGRSHECDHPPEVRDRPVVSRPALALGELTQVEIDTAVTERMRAGEGLYVVDEALLDALAPDVILTQNLCRVCAPSGNELVRALRALPRRSHVECLTPRTLAEMDEKIIKRASCLAAWMKQRKTRPGCSSIQDALRLRNQS